MNILEEIYQHKLVEVRNCKKNKSTHDICGELKLQNRKPQDFAAALQNKIINNDPAIICEVKKASPSKGIIRDDFDPVKIAKIYEENGAACISVLTDEKYFMGHSKYLSDIRKNVKIPILRKDFIIDVYQIYEAKLLGADCILLIMAMLDLQKAQELEKIAHDIGLSVLIEIHDEAELEKALKLRSTLIGINNRNLKTFEIDINNSIKLSKLIPKDKIIICESGIYSRDDIKKMQLENINSFLIGESLMRQDNIAQALQSLLEKESCFF